MEIDISNATIEHLSLISDIEAKNIIHKGWSLSFVYSFQEIRDVFLAFKRYGQNNMTVAEFSNRYVKNKIPFEKRPWDEKGRRVLEIKNALINFGLMEKESLLCKPNVFKEAEPGEPLSEGDKKVFRDIFFHYFRLLEFSSLFIQPDMSKEEKMALTEEKILKNSRVLYYYCSSDTRVDTFFYTLNCPKILYRFPISKEGKVNGGFMRFWDMFLSWASLKLGLVERLNMKRQHYLLSNGKAFCACYFINPWSKVNIQEVINVKFRQQFLIDISNLVMELCLYYRCSINVAQQAVIDFYLTKPEKVSLIRTSEIFIKETELNKNDRILYPKYKGSFVSHIKLRNYE